MVDVRQATMQMLQGDGVGVFIGADGKVHTSEGFFKQIGRLIKGLAKLPTLIGVLIGKAIPMMIKIMMEIIKLIPKVVTGFLKTFRYIASDPVMFLFKIIQLVLGTWLLFWLVIGKHLLSYIAVVLVALGVVVPLWCLWNIITLLFMAWALVLAMCDHLSGGVIRFLARAEDHPEAWWQYSGFEEGNGHMRVFGTYMPCGAGYGPGILGGMCWKLERSCAAAACPLATLMRCARTSYFRTTASIATGMRIVASREAACRERVRKQRNKCTASLTAGTRLVNEHVMHAPTMKELARCLSLCRQHALSGGALVKRDLAAGAVEGDPLTSRILGSITPVYPRTGLGLPVSNILAISVAVVVVAWTAARSSETMLALARQTQ
jgi:hypothetical protein